MLQRQAFQEGRPDEDSGSSLSLASLLEILKRRALQIVIPFLLIFSIGLLVAVVWPAKYLSEGKILVSSQEIPTDLVRPTVATLANERMQVIEQRIMTRDNLLALDKKFQLTSGWQGSVLGTDIVDFIRDRTKIKPLELNLPGDRKGAIAFTVGFEYESAPIAVKVANELVTMILNEDIRTRTNSATETTRFLDQEVKRMESEISSIDAQYVELKNRKISNPTEASESDDAKEIAQLRAELLLKSATYSDTHPEIVALKRKLEAFQKPTLLGKITADASQGNSVEKNKKVEAAPKTALNSDASGLDAIVTKRQNLISELTIARQKLTAARLGESLERGQYSERLEVIEQATLPKKPVSPNRPKIVGIAFVVGLMAAGGIVFAGEALNPAIRRTTDLFAIIDSHLVVSIPYISRLGEVRRRKRNIIIVTGSVAAVVVAGLIAGFFLLPPIDILFAKVMTALFR